jgi:hypothetical protein
LNTTKTQKAVSVELASNMLNLVSRLGLLVGVPLLASAQISLVHVTSCGPQTLPASVCTIPATGSGNVIIVGFQMGGGGDTSTTVGSVTDDAGNAYVEAGSAPSLDSSGGSVVDIWYAKNSTSGATTVTVSPSATTTNAGVVIWEFSGVDRIAPFDQTAALNSQDASDAPAGASVTTTSASEVVISLMAVAGNVTGPAQGNAFTIDSSIKGNGWAHLITSSTGTFAAQFNQSPAGTYASSTVSFKAASSSGNGSQSQNACDLNGDGTVNIVDVQLATNMYLGLLNCTANIAGPGVCSSLVVQQVVNAVLTGTCVTAGSHTVSLNWTASTTPNVNYNVYRSATSGGPYTKLNSVLVNGVSYTDSAVLPGQTYYYVTTAVDSNNNESVYSNSATAAIPFP